MRANHGSYFITTLNRTREKSKSKSKKEKKLRKN